MRSFLITDPVNDIILMTIVGIISIVTTIGGVGGGGLLIPLYMLFGGFLLEESIPLTIFTILGDTLVRIYFLYNKKHPLNKKIDLIYFNPLLLITLFDANTSFFGVILSNYFPSLITIISLISILGITFYKSIIKAISTYQKEIDYLNNPNSELTLIMIDGIGEYFNLNKIKNENLNIESEYVNIRSMNEYEIIDEDVVIDGIELRNDLENNSVHFIGDTKKQKYYNTFLMFLNTGIIAVFSFTRKYFNVCNYLYWIHSFGQFIICILLGYYNINYLLEDYKNKKNNNYIFIDGDIHWNKKVVRKFILIGTITGFVSTYIGIGGGMLTTPIMIQVGMLPEVVVATSSISTLFSCIISSLNYLASNKLDIIYGSAFALCSGIGSVGGIYGSNYILSKFKKQSPIIFIVSLIIFLSIILLTVNAIQSKSIYDTKFKNICEN